MQNFKLKYFKDANEVIVLTKLILKRFQDCWNGLFPVTKVL